MTKISYASISYGILFGDQLPPWHEHQTFNLWWMFIKGADEACPYNNPYNKDGSYSQGYTCGDYRIPKWHHWHHQWRRRNPAPVTIVDCHSYDGQLCIIAIPESVKICCGMPTEFDLNNMKPPSSWKRFLIAFCERYKIEMLNEPKWYLSS